MLTERENALRVITRSGDPEWIPISDECFYTIIPDAMKERPNMGEDGLDWFGCNWYWDAQSFGFAQKPDRLSPDFDDVTRWREFVKFPDLDAIDWEASAKRDLANVDREAKLVRLFVESGPFERLHHFLAFEGAMVSMLEEPEATHELIDAIVDYKVKLFDKLAQYYKPDVVVAHDDLGMANAPMMSVDMYREFYKEAHKKIGDCLHKHGIYYLYHSCGRMQEFIGDLIECGADIINPIQSVNDQAWVQQTYGDKASFEIVTDRMVHMATTTEEELRAEMRRILDIFAPKKNVIMCPFSYQPGYSEIMIDEIKKYSSKFF